MGMEFQFEKMKTFWRWMVMMVVQQYEYMKHYGAVHFRMVEMVNCICVFYQNLKNGNK